MLATYFSGNQLLKKRGDLMEFSFPDGSQYLIDDEQLVSLRCTLNKTGAPGVEYLSDIALAKWLLTPDIASRFPLRDHQGILAYIYWFYIVYCKSVSSVENLQAEYERVGQALAIHVVKPTGIVELPLTLLMLAVHAYRQDLHETFDLGTSKGLAQLCSWYYIFGVVEERLIAFVQPGELAVLCSCIMEEEGLDVLMGMYLPWHSEVAQYYDFNDKESRQSFVSWFLTEEIWSRRLDYVYKDDVLERSRLAVLPDGTCRTNVLRHAAAIPTRLRDVPSFIIAGDNINLLEDILRELQCGIEDGTISPRIVSPSCYSVFLFRYLPERSIKLRRPSFFSKTKFKVNLNELYYTTALGAGRDHLLSGWHNPEDMHTWQNGNVSSLAIWVDCGGHSRMILEFNMKYNFLSQVNRCPWLYLCLNNMVIYAQRVNSNFNNGTTVSTEVASRRLNANKVNIVTFIVSDIIIPIKCGISECDSRPLGIGLLNFRIQTCA